MTVLLREPLGGGVIVAVDPGKVVNRVWVTDRHGLIGEPLSLPTSRDGIEVLERLVDERVAVFAIEATGSLHRAWATELERRRPGSLRLFAPSETQAARAQLGTRRFKTDDRDCAALVWLARRRSPAGHLLRGRCTLATTISVTIAPGETAGGDGVLAMPHDGAT